MLKLDNASIEIPISFVLQTWKQIVKFEFAKAYVYGHNWICKSYFQIATDAVVIIILK